MKDLDSIIEKFFPNNRQNILSRDKADSEKLFKIKLKENELNTNLPYMGHVYIIDDEGYFRGLIYLDKDQTSPNFILDNVGRVKVWYSPFQSVAFKRDLNKVNNFTEDEKIPLTEGIKYLLENSEQIKKPEYKIAK